MPRKKIEEFCDQCMEKKELRFVEKDKEYLIYECPTCDSTYRFLPDEIEEEL